MINFIQFCCVVEFKMRINFLYSRISNGEGKFYQCLLCDFQTEIGKDIKNHFLEHTKAKKFTCDMCEFSTFRKSEIESHRDMHVVMRYLKKHTTV